jgi:hypothetical protein
MSEAVNVHRSSLTMIGKLTPHPQNYREHPEDQLAHIEQSIREHGFYRNVVAARDFTILAGHGVVEASRRLGLEKVPVIRLDLDPLEPRALKILAGDNELARLGVIDDRALSELLKTINETDTIGLLGTGYDPSMLANLVFVTRPASEIASIDAAAHWVGMPEYPESDDKSPRVIVQFDTEADREKFMKLIKVHTPHYKLRGVWSIWWPARGREDPGSLRFKDTEDDS